MKKYYIPFGVIALGALSFIAYIIKGSYVVADGTLVESFGFIPVGFVFIILGFIIGLAVSGWSLFHKSNKLDKLIFGILSAGSILFVVYLIIVAATR